MLCGPFGKTLDVIYLFTLRLSSEFLCCIIQLSVVKSNISRVLCQVVTDAPSVAKVEAAPLKVMIAGAPAAGKGTQCQKIVDKVGATPHSSFGWQSLL